MTNNDRIMQKTFTFHYSSTRMESYKNYSREAGILEGQVKWWDKILCEI